MRYLTIKLMKFMLNRAKINRVDKDPIIQQAYDNMIKSYETTIMFLKANKK